MFSSVANTDSTLANVHILFNIILPSHYSVVTAFSVLTLLAGCQEEHLACKKTESWCWCVIYLQ